MKYLRGLPLLVAGLLLMSTPAFAADYNFETTAPQDYYGSTSYETVYGAQYNYGGINAVDFLDPLAEGAPVSTITSGGSLEYGIQASGGASTRTAQGAHIPSKGESQHYPHRKSPLPLTWNVRMAASVLWSFQALASASKPTKARTRPPCAKVWGTSQAPPPGTEISAYAGITGAQAIISAQSRIWKSATRSAMRPALGQGPTR